MEPDFAINLHFPVIMVKDRNKKRTSLVNVNLPAMFDLQIIENIY